MADERARIERLRGAWRVTKGRLLRMSNPNNQTPPSDDAGGDETLALAMQVVKAAQAYADKAQRNALWIIFLSLLLSTITAITAIVR